MSNYPPGVTGREPQISGYPEKEEARFVICKAERFACSFEGTVLATVINMGDDEAEVQWRCPTCKQWNIEFEDIDRGPDPDDQRERANDERYS